jgi:predicted transcriptional regulator
MPQTWRELKNRTMTTTEQGRAHKMAEHNLTEIKIGELRAALEMTQADLADKLKVTQAAVSRLEGRSDWHLSTLREYVEALGDKMEVRVFPRRTVRLTHATTATAAKTAHRR